MSRGKEGNLDTNTGRPASRPVRIQHSVPTSVPTQFPTWSVSFISYLLHCCRRPCQMSRSNSLCPEGEMSRSGSSIHNPFRVFVNHPHHHIIPHVRRDECDQYPLFRRPKSLDVVGYLLLRLTAFGYCQLRINDASAIYGRRRNCSGKTSELV